MGAWQILKDETCPHCGTPFWIGYSPDSRIIFDANTTKCYGCAAEKDYKKTHEKDEDDVYVVPHMEWERDENNKPYEPPLPTRADYYKVEAKRQAKMESRRLEEEMGAR